MRQNKHQKASSISWWGFFNFQHISKMLYSNCRVFAEKYHALFQIPHQGYSRANPICFRSNRCVADFGDLSDIDQVLRALRGLIQEELLLRVGYGVYVRAKRSRFSGKLLPETDLRSIAITALRKNGVTAHKPIQTLRKEAGSEVCRQYGLHAPSTFLRHADIQVTSNHYVENKRTIRSGFGALLASNIEDIEQGRKAE